MLRNFIKTDMVKRYSFKLFIRVAIFVSVFALYIINKDLIKEILNMKFTFGIINYGITPMHVIWLVFMVMMITHLFPNDKLSMALRKNKKETYVEVPGYNQLELMKFVQGQNIKAWSIMLLWLCFNAIWGLLYLFGIMDVADLFMLTVFISCAIIFVFCFSVPFRPSL
ncbi:MAG: hypothetical protein J6L65_00060 [Lachnospiraceae bacterium]|nr:hypothetical protein [Lachnospiraceae bacterium]